MPESTLEAVLKYLKEKFPDADLQPTKTDETRDIHVDVGDLPLRISAEFLETVEPDEVVTVLDWLNIAEALRRAEGLPMVLTEHGIKLESSN